MKDVSMRYNKSTEMVMEVRERQFKNLGYTRYYLKSEESLENLPTVTTENT